MSLPITRYGHREAFTFGPERNAFICPNGKLLKHRTAVEAIRIHIYRPTVKTRGEFPIRSQCTRGLMRTLSVPFDDSARQEIIALQDTPAFQRSRLLRRKVEMRGLSAAAEEFLMMATVQNLRRLGRMRPPDIPKSRRAAHTLALKA